MTTIDTETSISIYIHEKYMYNIILKSLKYISCVGTVIIIVINQMYGQIFEIATIVSLRAA